MNPTFQDVLVVDDFPDTRANLRHILETAGFRVRSAENGADALQLVRQQCPYFVVTDWRVAPINGLEFCSLLRKETLPHYVYVVLLTSKSHDDDIIAGLNAGADDFIVKPVSKGQLLARLRAGARVLDLESRLSQLARCDTITGSLNSRTFCQLLEKEWSRSIRYRRPLSCVAIGIDDFKTINDTYGRVVGDEVLRSVAQLTETKCRCPDYVCHWSDDRFYVLLPETGEEGATCWAGRCCTAIADIQQSFKGQRFAVTASFGVVQQHEGMKSHEQLLELADQALCAAKESGGSRVVDYSTMTEDLVGSGSI